MKSLKEQVAEADLERRKVKDFDPEDDEFPQTDDDESEAEEGAENDGGREHYEVVGKSRMRKPEQPTLDAKYGGVAVSRSALDQEDPDDNDPFAPVEEDQDDDPFAVRKGKLSGSDDGSDALGDLDPGSGVDEDEEIDSDEALGESDVERFKDFHFRGSRKNRIASPSEDDGSEEGSEEEESDEDIDDEGTDGSDDLSTEDSDVEMEDEDDEDEDTMLPSRSAKSTLDAEREELRKAAFSSGSTAGLAAALSAGAQADVKKGQSVKQQRQTFDRLLDVRIKLQKGVAATNELPDTAVTDKEIQRAAKQAEDAALALWTTIDSIRCAILSAQEIPLSNGKASKDSSSLKRKRPFTATRSTSLSEIWEQTTSLESTIQPVRRSTLDKWHAKTQPAQDSNGPRRSKLLQHPSSSSGSGGAQSRLTDVLDTYLAAETPKLSGTATRPDDGNPAPPLYDDTAFYQSLLRELIASRSTASASASGTSTAAATPLPTKLHTSGSAHKRVDTKASKGRKVRYTVHEKLENFMAPEDRTLWAEAARSEFFGSLLGRAGALLDEAGSDDDEDQDRDGDGDEDDAAEGAALRLFRN